MGENQKGKEVRKEIGKAVEVAKKSQGGGTSLRAGRIKIKIR